MSVISEEKQPSECSQRFPLKVVKLNSVVSVVSKEKLRSERSQIFHFNSSEIKQRSECNQ